MLLSAAQVNHWVVFYDVKEEDDDGDGWNKDSWFEDRAWLKDKFPLINLPFLVDCATDRVISQTNAITAYLGRELKLLGTTNKDETSQCEELLFEINDLRNLMLDFAYKTDQSTCKEDAQQMIRAANCHFERLENHLKKAYPPARNRTDPSTTVDSSMSSVVHLVNNAFTAPDFHLWEILDQFEGLCKRFDFPNCLGDEATTYLLEPRGEDQKETRRESTAKETVYPYLKEFHDIFIDLPQNKVYRTQYGLDVVTHQQPIRLPYNNPYARFGSCPDPCKTYVRGQDTPWRNRGTILRIHTRTGTGCVDDIEHWDDVEDIGKTGATHRRKQKRDRTE